ncbi:MAG TPA: recombination mediator RecR [Clostridia bacterium]|jgi:recombination protein RecR|nr:recombination mediator RecR [Clostridia bacterium]
MAVDAIEQLVTELCHLPGVGRKSAQRFAYAILAMKRDEAVALSASISDAVEKVHPCPVCGGYTDAELCDICSDPKRGRELVCVVSYPKDVAAMEKTREFRGCYHVLGGVLSPADGVGPDDLRIPELRERCERDKVTEVILATDSDVKGDVTAGYIAKVLKPLGVRVTKIARGIPIGGNLEYTDEVTLAKALEGRSEF